MFKKEVAFFGEPAFTSPSSVLKTYLVCLHDQSKSGFFGGPAFFQPISFFLETSDCSDWLDKIRPSKKATLF